VDCNEQNGEDGWVRHACFSIEAPRQEKHITTVQYFLDSSVMYCVTLLHFQNLLLNHSGVDFYHMTTCYAVLYYIQRYAMFL